MSGWLPGDDEKMHLPDCRRAPASRTTRRSASAVLRSLSALPSVQVGTLPWLLMMLTGAPMALAGSPPVARLIAAVAERSRLPSTPCSPAGMYFGA
ncbi:hypothetical protein GCM10010274_59830 [Streptomyces lavendofoliae]|uniref:Uncharacterized protein n=1 Tax=Streptomyces lavendofoliae TaxID=67314 RepID=A0A918I528_9ACTN|nr:hypothetical protein GCM10010274_59830 [Streptomyces lavendofoliae]